MFGAVPESHLVLQVLVGCLGLLDPQLEAAAGASLGASRELLNFVMVMAKAAGVQRPESGEHLSSHI